jgi:hypothetical protein
MKTRTLFEMIKVVPLKKLFLASLIAASMVGPVQAHSRDHWIGSLVTFAVIDSIFDRGHYNQGHYHQYKKIKRRSHSHSQSRKLRRHNHSQGSYSISRKKHRNH